MGKYHNLLLENHICYPEEMSAKKLPFKTWQINFAESGSGKFECQAFDKNNPEIDKGINVVQFFNFTTPKKLEGIYEVDESGILINIAGGDVELANLMCYFPRSISGNLEERLKSTSKEKNKVDVILEYYKEQDEKIEETNVACHGCAGCGKTLQGAYIFKVNNPGCNETTIPVYLLPFILFESSTVVYYATMSEAKIIEAWTKGNSGQMGIALHIDPPRYNRDFEIFTVSSMVLTDSTVSEDPPCQII